MARIFSCALICFISFSNFSSKIDGLSVNRITIHYIFSGTETGYDLSCEAIDASTGNKDLMTKEVRNYHKISQFMNSLREYKPTPEIKKLDVRAKAYIRYSNGKNSIVCLDRFGHFKIDGKIVGISPLLLSFIEKNCKGFK